MRTESQGIRTNLVSEHPESSDPAAHLEVRVGGEQQRPGVRAFHVERALEATRVQVEADSSHVTQIQRVRLMATTHCTERPAGAVSCTTVEVVGLRLQ